MSNEYAIEVLKETLHYYEEELSPEKTCSNIWFEIEKKKSALRLAIDALEKQESIRDGKWIHDNVPVCCLACPTCEGKHSCAYHQSECAEKQVSPDMEDKDELDITSN